MQPGLSARVTSGVHPPRVNSRSQSNARSVAIFYNQHSQARCCHFQTDHFHSACFDVVLMFILQASAGRASIGWFLREKSPRRKGDPRHHHRHSWRIRTGHVSPPLLCDARVCGHLASDL